MLVRTQALQQFVASMLKVRIRHLPDHHIVWRLVLQKDEELQQLEEKYLQEEKVIGDLINIKDEKLAHIKNLGGFKDQQKLTLSDIKEKCSELIVESENLNAIVQ